MADKKWSEMTKITPVDPDAVDVMVLSGAGDTPASDNVRVAGSTWATGAQGDKADTAVQSVNGETGTSVTLDTDNIADTATNRYTNDTDATRLANTSGTNTGDDSGYDTVADAGGDQIKRDTILFTGAGVTVSDTGTQTEVVIPGGTTPAQTTSGTAPIQVADGAGDPVVSIDNFTGTTPGAVPDGTAAGGTKVLQSDGTWVDQTGGGGVPAGGDAGQILGKLSGADQDANWIETPVGNFRRKLPGEEYWIALVGQNNAVGVGQVEVVDMPQNALVFDWEGAGATTGPYAFATADPMRTVTWGDQGDLIVGMRGQTVAGGAGTAGKPYGNIGWAAANLLAKTTGLRVNLVSVAQFGQPISAFLPTGAVEPTMNTQLSAALADRGATAYDLVIWAQHENDRSRPPEDYAADWLEVKGNAEGVTASWASKYDTQWAFVGGVYYESGAAPQPMKDYWGGINAVMEVTDGLVSYVNSSGTYDLDLLGHFQGPDLNNLGEQSATNYLSGPVSKPDERMGAYNLSWVNDNGAVSDVGDVQDATHFSFTTDVALTETGQKLMTVTSDTNPNEFFIDSSGAVNTFQEANVSGAKWITAPVVIQSDTATNFNFNMSLTSLSDEISFSPNLASSQVITMFDGVRTNDDAPTDVFIRSPSAFPTALGTNRIGGSIHIQGGKGGGVDDSESNGGNVYISGGPERDGGVALGRGAVLIQDTVHGRLELTNTTLAVTADTEIAYTDSGSADWTDPLVYNKLIMQLFPGRMTVLSGYAGVYKASLTASVSHSVADSTIEYAFSLPGLVERWYKTKCVAAGDSREISMVSTFNVPDALTNTFIKIRSDKTGTITTTAADFVLAKIG